MTTTPLSSLVKTHQLRFADDIDPMGGISSERQELTNRLEERARAYRMEVSTDKLKIMVNSTTNTSADITMNGEKLEEVTSFKYLGATLSRMVAVLLMSK